MQLLNKDIKMNYHKSVISQKDDTAFQELILSEGNSLDIQLIWRAK